MLTIRLVQWLGWVFETQERNKIIDPMIDYFIALLEFSDSGKYFTGILLDLQKKCH